MTPDELYCAGEKNGYCEWCLSRSNGNCHKGKKPNDK
jgi:hypothetical protein